MEIYKVTNTVTDKVLVVFTVYDRDHEWYELMRTGWGIDEFFRDIQSYGTEAFTEELLESIPYIREKSLKENRVHLKRFWKSWLIRIAAELGSDHLYNKVTEVGVPATNGRRAKYIYIFRGRTYSTGVEVYEAMCQAGYDITVGAVLKYLHHDGALSRKNQAKYPNLSKELQVIKSYGDR